MPVSDIITTVTANPVSVLVDEKTYSEFYAKMKEEIDGHEPDVSTIKGRSEIASLAYKVTRTKTAIDAAGKKLNEDARAKINAVDASRRKIREELDALAEEVRRPLTEYEEAERARAAKAKEILETVIALGNSSPHDSVDEIRDRMTEIGTVFVDPAIMGDQYDEAVREQQTSVNHLTEHLERALKAEADAAELARLRAANEEREAAEREAREKEEAERIEREARERAEAEYKANVEREAEKARQAEIAKAQIERDRIEREAAERVAKAEAEAKAIKDQAEREERERAEQMDRTRREEAARQADREHRGAVMKAAKEAIMVHGADEETAKKIVLAIVAGEVPHTVIRF